jgi:hypothetical protein
MTAKSATTAPPTQSLHFEVMTVSSRLDVHRYVTTTISLRQAGREPIPHRGSDGSGGAIHAALETSGAAGEFHGLIRLQFQTVSSVFFL